ncbi:DUF1707 SHOCT-like domain-containing protein [Amycolatopsis nalaikhensis]|uniref:DUF1707 domain-containing protein n=1 Tax=Amycolatopsis nalaikhensis TaxID=715472 RepID=A0ABY8XU89_9PSEU|nr:DUF1707 domain-containing protein [Amycolatopsis sp. 2-2]WIV59204.1 DUF1707 domain-containing protein [Amycolatopsis sp. 2-2]
MTAPVSSGDPANGEGHLREIRCSDDEREQTRLHLAEAAGEGRITVDEAEARLTQVAAARFRSELHDVTADLPPHPTRTSNAAGWLPVLALARRQLGADAAALVGRGEKAVSARRRLALVIAALTIVVVLAALFVAAFHGIGEDGFEHHEFGRG